MNCKELFHELTLGITLDAEKDEIESIAFALLADMFKISRNAVLSEEELSEWSPRQQHQIDEAIHRINKGEPVQYVTGKGHFYGREFFVNPHVLIPRPETEELVQEVIAWCRQQDSIKDFRILDIGTGSGCIPVTLAAELEDVTVIGTDVSEKALVVARQNAVAQRVAVQLLHHNVLTQPIPFQDLDVIVSNPPYIPSSESLTLNKNVIDYEPHRALFVDDEDPLLFYREISAKALDVLNHRGLLAFEVNERFGKEVKDVMVSFSFRQVEIVRDMSGKDRIVKGIKG